MKIKSKFVAGVAIATTLTASSFAGISVPADSSILNFGVNSEDLSAWHLGAYMGVANRTVEKNKMSYTADIKRYNMYLGYDVTRWLAAYLLVGMTDGDIDHGAYKQDIDSTVVWGGGVWANLIDSDQLDFHSTITRFRVRANAEMSYASFDEFDWLQMDASLVFGIQNEFAAGPNFTLFPEEVGVFLGPVFSYVDLSDGYELDSDNQFGITAGVELKFADHLFFTIACDFYSDDESVYGTFGVRF